MPSEVIFLENDPNFSEDRRNIPRHTFECRYLRDVWRFIKLIDETPCAVFQGMESPREPFGCFVITYQNSEELGMEVWT